MGHSRQLKLPLDFYFLSALEYILDFVTLLTCFFLLCFFNLSLSFHFFRLNREKIFISQRKSLHCHSRANSFWNASTDTIYFDSIRMNSLLRLTAPRFTNSLTTRGQQVRLYSSENSSTKMGAGRGG